MWACPECTKRLRRLAEMWAAPEGCLWEQLQVARHIAEAHPDEVPAPHPDDCGLCPSYARRDVDDRAGVWAEHLTRDLFMPSEIARLL
ncbi:hypothetical protein ACQKFA_19305 [Streptomyces sp. CH6]